MTDEQSLWEDFKHFRQEQKKKFVETPTIEQNRTKRRKKAQQKRISLCCNNVDCNSIREMVEMEPGVFTCTECWSPRSVVHTLAVDGAANGPRRYCSLSSCSAPYCESTHLQEVLAAINLSGPPIPEDLFALIEATWRDGFGATRELDRPKVKSILDATRVPAALQEKYRTTRYKRRLCSHLDDVKGYGERWIWIRFKLTGLRPPAMGWWLVDKIHKFFRALMEPWKELRHARDCRSPDRKTCHMSKSSQCRHNLPPYRYVLRHIFRLIESMFEGREINGVFEGQPATVMRKGTITDVYDWYLPPIKSKNTRRVDRMMKDMFDHWGWTKHFDASIGYNQE